MPEAPIRSFSTSEAMLDRALESIPLGSQTFSKSITQYPRGVSPFFMQRGQGARTWDVDGNEYIDYVNSLAAITLGHCDPDVTAAVEKQLKDGTIFSVAHPLEIEVAELIKDMVPCAEMVRFGKNGSDATSGAIRAARAYTGRDLVAMCGYHGWQDWSIGTTARNKGIPKAVQELTRTFAYNDLASLEALLSAEPEGYAAVILEPMNITWPKEGFLQGVVDLAHKYGAVVIFDETVTGFRFSEGGAQKLFGVTPDMATFGKGIANGYPLAAVAGRKAVMEEFAEIFFSFTMGGETLSLAAAKAVLTKLRTHDVINVLNTRGKDLHARVEALIAKHGCGEFLSMAGHPTWSFLVMNPANDATVFQIKTLWMQEIMARGILSVGTHNITFAHGPAEIDRLLQVYDEVFPILRDAIEGKRFRQYLRCKPLVPLFRVR